MSSDTGKRTYDQLSPESNTGSPDYKRHNICYEEDLTYIMATSGQMQQNGEPEWFTKAMCRLEAKLCNKLEAMETNFNLSIEHVTALANDAKKNSDENKKKVGEIEQLVHTKSNKMQNEMDKLQADLLDMQCYSRRENLKLEGIDEAPTGQHENCYEVIYDIFENVLKIENARNMKLDRCHRLGPPPIRRAKPTVVSKPRAIIVRFNWFADRMTVWNTRSMLKGTQFTISEDFPAPVEARRRQLLPVLKAAKQDGSIKKAFTKKDKLILDGMVYTVNDLHKLPVHLQPANIAKKETADVVLFFGRHSPLSNFSTSPFTIDGTTYSCMEQYLVHQKALLFSDDQAAYNVMQKTDPGDMKSTRIANFTKDVWLQHARDIAVKGLTEKFIQNPDCRAALLATEKKTIAEASPSDKVWGIGLHLQHKDAPFQNRWQGQNLLGTCLMAVRDTY